MQIHFNGHQYKLETLVSLVGFGRQEKVKTDDLVIVEGSDFESKVPVCFVYDNHTYVLAGKVNTDKSEQTVCILTKHVLKKALMSVQSQPMDTKVDFTAQQAVPLSNKTMAALASLNIGNVRPDAPRREYVQPKASESNEQTRRALQVLQATMSRKEENMH